MWGFNLLADALGRDSWHSRAAMTILKSWEGLRASTIAGGLRSGSWHYGRGLSQGRPESAHLWNSAMAVAMGQLMDSWTEGNMGTKWGNRINQQCMFCRQRVDPADSRHMLKYMLVELTQALAAKGLRWKRER